MQRLTGRWLTASNAMSFMRLPLAVLVVVYFDSAWRFVFVLLAIVSDVLDGWLARRRGESSPLGAFIDPLFDKLFVIIVFCFALLTLSLPLWYAVAFFFRDAVTALGAVWFFRALPEIKARWPGKIVTALQFVTLLALISHAEFVAQVSITLLAVVSVVSVYDYAAIVLRKSTTLTTPQAKL